MNFHAMAACAVLLTLSLASCAGIDRTAKTASVETKMSASGALEVKEIAPKRKSLYTVPAPKAVALRNTRNMTAPARRKPAMPAKQVASLSAEPLGNAPYICSPSGFGRTVRCYAR